MNNGLFHIFKGISVLSIMYMNMLKTYEIRYNDKLDTTTFLLGTKCVVVTSPDCSTIVLHLVATCLFISLIQIRKYPHWGLGFKG